MKGGLLLALVLSCVSAAPTLGAQDQAPTSTRLSPDQAVAEVVQGFARHNYFSKILVVEDRSFEPVRLLLQKPQVETAGWQQKTAAASGPWLKKLEEIFRKTYVEPFGLTKRDDLPVPIVCVLQTPGDYQNYGDAISARGVFGNVAHFERGARVMVTFDASAKVNEVQRRRAMLGEFTRALLYQYFHGSMGEPSASWLVEGLGAYLADQLTADTATLERPTLNPNRWLYLVGFAQDPKLRDVYLVPFATLAGFTTRQQMWDRASANAEALGVKVDDTAFSIAEYCQFVMWINFLQDAQEAKYRPRFSQYLTAVLAGRGASDSFAEAFQGLDLAELDRECYRSLFATYQAAFPNKPVDVRVIDLLFTKQPKGAAARAENAPPPTASTDSSLASKGAPPFDPRSVAPPDEDLSAQHGLVLQRIRCGDLDGALQDLQTLEARARGSAIERRLERELARLKGFVALRDAYVADLIAGGQKQTFEVDGKKLVAKVVKLENGRLLLGENRLKLESLPVATFSAAAIARDLPKKLADSSEGWLRAYALVLDGDEKAQRLLAGDAQEVVDLRNDAAEWYPGVLKLGLAAEALATLAKEGVPADAASAKVCIERISALRASYGQLELVAGRTTALAELARRALEKLYRPSELASVLPGVYEDLGGGRVRLTLDFQDPAQAATISAAPSLLVGYRKQFSPLVVVGDESTVRITDGGLRMRGSAVAKLALPFRAPVTVRAKVFHEQLQAASWDTMLLLFACFEGAGDHVACTTDGALLAVDEASHTNNRAWDSEGVYSGRNYLTELRVGNGKASSWVDGALIHEIASGARASGDVLLLTYSDSTVVIDSLVVEGELPEAPAREAWVNGKLAALGL